MLESQELSRDDVTDEYAFDMRQTNYYTDAARYLGLVDKKYDGRKPIYSLSEFGHRLMKLNYKQRQLALCKCILEHKVFFNIFTYCQCGSVPDRNTIVRIMKNPIYIKSNLKVRTLEELPPLVAGLIGCLV